MITHKRFKYSPSF